MFRLAEMSDMVRVPANKFNLHLELAISEELDRKLANKIVPDVGLCICLFDIVKLGKSYIFPGDEASHTQTTFRYVVFRPSPEEIIQGTIKGSSALGLQVTLGFFDGIFIRAADMVDGSFYDQTEKVWIWKYNDHPLYMDNGQKIQVRVMSEVFEDTTPTGPELAAEERAATAAAGQDHLPPQPPKDPLSEIHPYTVFGSINGPGLGVLSWWDEDNSEEVQEEQVDE